MAYASQAWTKNLLSETLKQGKEQGLLGSGGSGVAIEEYSDKEIIIGKWSDGRPLYRKCFKTEISGITDGTYKTFNIVNLPNVNEIKSITGTVNTSGTIQPIPYQNNNMDRNIKYQYVKSSSNITLITNVNYVATVYTVVEYTKTTDAVNSFSPSMVTSSIGLLNNYSTDEIVIGKWIDGKAIYRKVVKGTMGTITNAWKTIGSISSDFDEIINIYGSSKGSDGANFGINIFRSPGSDFSTVVGITTCITTAGNINVAWCGADDYRKEAAITVIVEYTKK